jgi:uncharacterized membrane protein
VFHISSYIDKIFKHNTLIRIMTAKKDANNRKGILKDGTDYKTLRHEDMTIDDLNSDIEKKLQEQGVIFDKKRFYVEEKHMTFGDRLADSVARVGGSWAFIIGFLSVMAVWIIANVILIGYEKWDPYPFILLNLCLSCLAAIQAPIIMMSQNRQEEKARKQQEINLEKDIVDFKQDRLDVIVDQKSLDILMKLEKRLDIIEKKLDKKKS